MTSQSEDERLEAYLRQFRPHQPRALPALRASSWRRAIAGWAAVAALLLMAALMFVPRRGVQLTKQMPPPKSNDIAADASLADLNRVLRQGPEKLESQLDSLASRLLPDVRSKSGILKTLARE